MWHLFRGIGNRGPGPPPDFADVEKLTEAEIDNLFVVGSPDFGPSTTSVANMALMSFGLLGSVGSGFTLISGTI